MWAIFYSKLKKVMCIIFAISLIFCTTSDEKTSESKDGGLSSNSGNKTFSTYCVLCHGSDGKMGLNGAKDLSLSILDLEGRMKIIKEGKDLMTPFGELLSDEEIKAVAQYTMEKFSPKDINNE